MCIRDRAMNSVEGVFGRLRTPYKKLIMGGAMLSILIFLFPPLYGEGYDTIELLLNGVRSASVIGFSSRVSVAIFRLLTGVFT